MLCAQNEVVGQVQTHPAHASFNPRLFLCLVRQHMWLYANRVALLCFILPTCQAAGLCQMQAICTVRQPNISIQFCVPVSPAASGHQPFAYHNSLFAHIKCHQVLVDGDRAVVVLTHRCHNSRPAGIVHQKVMQNTKLWLHKVEHVTCFFWRHMTGLQQQHTQIQLHAGQSRLESTSGAKAMTKPETTLFDSTYIS